MSSWVELLIRSAVILAAGEAIRLACSRAHPGFRHRVVLLALSAVLLLPVLSAVLPELPVQLWHNSTTSPGVTTQGIAFHSRRGPPHTFLVQWMLVFWGVGFCLSLVPLIAGWVSMSRIVRRASPFCDPAWIRMLEELSVGIRLRRPPEIFVSDQVAVPLTFGLLEPKIVLPPTCREWSATRRRAVLLHELAHLRRRDLISQFCAYLIAAIWWFQPLVWLSLRSLRHESELACDAETVAHGLEPSSYAIELLEIARALKSDTTNSAEHAWSNTAISMARPHQLERRVKAILSQSVPGLSLTRRLSSLTSLCLIAVTASAVTPVSKNVHYGGLHMRRTLLSTLLASAGLSAATVSGSLFDPSGAAIPDAKVLLYNSDTGLKQETTTGAEGRFAIENAPPGDSILRIEKPGFSALLREFSLKADSKIDKGLIMEIGRAREELQVQARGRAAAASQSSPSEPIRLGGRVAQANLLTKIQPIYPAAAKAAGVQGIVELEAVISMEGVPLDIRVVSSPSDELSEASLEAVRQWRYRPTLLNGNPVEIVTDVIVRYALTQ